MKTVSLVLVVVASVVVTRPARGEETGKDGTGKAEKRESQTIKGAPFRVEVTAPGVFEPTEAQGLQLRPKVWSSLKVEHVVREGTAVQAGDEVLRLETTDIDRDIEDRAFELQLTELSIAQAEIELDVLQKTVPLDLEAARRTKQIQAEDLRYFLEVDRAQRIRSADEGLKGSRYSLEYAQEELDQLTKMYEADDLTEETEEIILKRAKRDVERSEFFLESSQLSHDRTIGVLLPREEKQKDEAAVRAELSLMKAEASLPRSIERTHLELRKLARTRDQAAQKLAEVRADREQFVLRAPVAGTVFYGELERGRWATASALRKQLRPGGTVSSNAVLLTIVPDGSPLVARLDIAEKDYRRFRPGVDVRIKPAAFPGVIYLGQCVDIRPVQVKEGTFDGTVSLQLREGQPAPAAGMTCDVSLTAYQKSDAFAIPTSAVFYEDTDPEAAYVYVEDGGEARKQPVTTGEVSKDKTEITSGLQDGDVVLLSKP